MQRLSPDETDVQRKLEQMSLSQLYELMVQAKGVMLDRPDDLRRCLEASPALTYALAEAALKLGMAPSPPPRSHWIAAPPPPAPTLTIDQLGLLERVKQLTPEQIAQLPVQDQGPILAIRAQLAQTPLM